MSCTFERLTLMYDVILNQSSKASLDSSLKKQKCHIVFLLVEFWDLVLGSNAAYCWVCAKKIGQIAWKSFIQKRNTPPKELHYCCIKGRGLKSHSRYQSIMPCFSVLYVLNIFILSDQLVFLFFKFMSFFSNSPNSKLAVGSAKFHIIFFLNVSSSFNTVM